MAKKPMTTTQLAVSIAGLIVVSLGLYQIHPGAATVFGGILICVIGSRL